MRKDRVLANANGDRNDGDHFQTATVPARGKKGRGLLAKRAGKKGNAHDDVSLRVLWVGGGGTSTTL